MADSNSYPQIPTTVWWGVRALLNKTPRAAVTEDLLGVELGVQPAAAKQYVTELKRVGLVNDENRATDVAHKWRMSDTYAEAVEAILNANYGEGLRTVASTPADRAKAVDWFQRQGLGEGSARNKAATYFLIASSEPGESPGRGASPTTARPRAAKSKDQTPTTPSSSSTTDRNAPPKPGGGETFSAFPINLNLQIHISADASLDQIDAIFSSMRKHLGNARLS